MLGIFDSGIWGLKLVLKLKSIFPKLSFIYLGDTLHSPYGKKDKSTIKTFGTKSIEYLKTLGCSHILNLSPSFDLNANHKLKHNFTKEIINNFINLSKRKRIGILSDRAVLESSFIHKILKSQDIKLFLREGTLIEDFLSLKLEKRPEFKKIIRRYVAYLKMNNIDYLLALNPSYSWCIDIIQRKAGKKINTIDFIEFITEIIKAELKNFQNSKSEILLTDLNWYSLSRVKEINKILKADIKKINL